MNIAYALITAYQLGKTNDSGVILYWSGIYIILSWVIFIFLPSILIKKLRFGKTIYFAAPIMGMYAGIIFTLLFDPVFEFRETNVSFLPYAILTGLIYGALITLVALNQNIEKAILILIPTIGIGFYVLFPNVFPSQAFRFMPDDTQDKIVSRVIPKLKVGDTYKTFLDILPNAYNSEYSINNLNAMTSKAEEVTNNYNSAISVSNKYISFDMKVENDIITELNYKLNE